MTRTEDFTWGWAAVVLKLNCSPVLQGTEGPLCHSQSVKGKSVPTVPLALPHRPEHKVIYAADPELIRGVDW